MSRYFALFRSLITSETAEEEKNRLESSEITEEEERINEYERLLFARKILSKTFYFKVFVFLSIGFGIAECIVVGYWPIGYRVIPDRTVELYHPNSTNVQLQTIIPSRLNTDQDYQGTHYRLQVSYDTIFAIINDI